MNASGWSRRAAQLSLAVLSFSTACASRTGKVTPRALPGQSAAVDSKVKSKTNEHSKPEIVATRPVRTGIQLAVMPLVNKTGNASFDDAGAVLAERISIRLSGFKNVTVVERARLNEVLDELALTERVPMDGAKVVQIGRLLGANYMIFGSLVQLGEQPSFSLRIVSVETGEIIGGAMIDTAGKDDFDRASTAAAKELVPAIQGFKSAAAPAKL